MPNRHLELHEYGLYYSDFPVWQEERRPAFAVVESFAVKTVSLDDPTWYFALSLSNGSHQIRFELAIVIGPAYHARGASDNRTPVRHVIAGHKRRGEDSLDTDEDETQASDFAAQTRAGMAFDIHIPFFHCFRC